MGTVTILKQCDWCTNDMWVDDCEKKKNALKAKGWKGKDIFYICKECYHEFCEDLSQSEVKEWASFIIGEVTNYCKKYDRRYGNKNYNYNGTFGFQSSYTTEEYYLKKLREKCVVQTSLAIVGDK